jgi:KTSC domain-containing protein
MNVTAVESSTLATIAYDEIHELLQLEFHSRALYQYFSVPAAVHEGLQLF